MSCDNHPSYNHCIMGLLHIATTARHVTSMHHVTMVHHMVTGHYETSRHHVVSVRFLEVVYLLVFVYPVYGTMLGKSNLKDRELKREGENLNALQQKVSKSLDPDVIYYFLAD